MFQSFSPVWQPFQVGVSVSRCHWGCVVEWSCMNMYSHFQPTCLGWYFFEQCLVTAPNSLRDDSWVLLPHAGKASSSISCSALFGDLRQQKTSLKLHPFSVRNVSNPWPRLRLAADYIRRRFGICWDPRSKNGTVDLLKFVPPDVFSYLSTILKFNGINL